MYDIWRELSFRRSWQGFELAYYLMSHSYIYMHDIDLVMNLI